MLGSILLLTICGSAAPQGETPYTALFDGKTLDGWEGDPTHWRVEDGVIVGDITPERPLTRNAFLVWKDGELDDFELRLRYRIEGGNSGIQYRSVQLPNGDLKGNQADLDGLDAVTGACFDEHGRFMLAMRGERVTLEDGGVRVHVERFAKPADLQAHLHRGAWNEYEIRAQGRHVVHRINGQLMAEVTDNDDLGFRRHGRLALQLHAGGPARVEFKDLRLRRFLLNDQKKIVLVAGAGSHGYAAHEHRAGCALLARLLNANVAGVLATVCDGGWPRDPSAFDNADAVVLYLDGGDGHAALPHLDKIKKLIRSGVGLACLHYALEVPKDRGQDLWLEAIGGAFETHWSTTQAWTAEFSDLPPHPITQGVAPFTLHDEWYFHMRFRPELRGVQPILTATPPDAAHDGPDGAHSGNEHVRGRKGQPETVAWAVTRPDNGRGFGFTGGHIHWNWAHDQFRKLVLNALVWVARAEVPENGVITPAPTLAELQQGLDEVVPDGFDNAAVQQLLRSFADR